MFSKPTQGLGYRLIVKTEEKGGDRGLAKAKRSKSSNQERHSERPLWRFSDMWLRKAQKVGVAIGAWD
ncbi:hypothetical protein Pyn_40978 [Prunus yedoensis var. nudiflora]|uniref:Uncharacterized protein n=1 Tax=Prunus yedoensis var. nudiflora TaxID=2094558 RepID=A0A314YSS0_PRUYE|nr:hypothetical protein Pyn_40978 [Prunus yedoensis var. nudiflora]